MRRWWIAAVASAIVWLLAAPSAYAGQGSGEFEITQDGGYLVRYHLDGQLLPARAEARAVGWPVDDDLVDSDDRYVRADLTEIAHPSQTWTCGDGSGTGSITWTGIADPTAVLTTDLTLDLRRGTGNAEIAVAHYPYPVIGPFLSWLSGQADVVYDDCFEPVTWSGPVVGDEDPNVEIFSGFVLNRALNLRWPLTLRHGAWVASSTHTMTVTDTTSVKLRADVEFSGSPTSMHALCVTPTTKDLRPAGTVAGAKRILAEAGFAHVVVTKPQYTRAAPKGHYYLSNLIGNRNPIGCGYRKIHLTRSLGWPFG